MPRMWRTRSHARRILAILLRGIATAPFPALAPMELTLGEM